MFLTANIVASILLFGEAFLAYMAFSGLPNPCSSGVYPCQVNALYNNNFQDIPFIG